MKRIFKAIALGFVALSMLASCTSPSSSPSNTSTNSSIPSEEVEVTASVAPDITPLATPSDETVVPAPANRRIVGYFCEWRDEESAHNYTVHDIPWGKITHINYAFAEIDSAYKIALLDKELALEKEYEGQDASLPYKGHFNLLNTYKKQYPDTQLLISVGGWTKSGGFFEMMDTQQGIDTFADSCVEFLRTYNFDGIDIDFEYPSSTKESGNPIDSELSETRRKTLYENYITLIKTLREKIDAASTQDGKDYLLTAAVSASCWVLGGAGHGEYAKYLDYINMMTYDFHGTWNNVVGPQSALYYDNRDPETVAFPIPVLSIEWAYNYYRGAVAPEKLNVGVPFYTRGWQSVAAKDLPGGLWGTGGGGAEGEAGYWNAPDEPPAGTNPLWHVKNLLNTGAYEYFFDEVSKTPYVWNEEKRIFLTFEDETSMAEKAQFVIDNNIGGIIIWELAGDFKLEGDKYVPGDTLTTVAKDMFNAAAPLKTTPLDPKPSADQISDYTYLLKTDYSYPNFFYELTITNHTDTKIESGFLMEFDFPNSSSVLVPSGMTLESSTENGDFTHYIFKAKADRFVDVGGSLIIKGQIKIPYTGGIKNFQINGAYSISEFVK